MKLRVATLALAVAFGGTSLLATTATAQSTSREQSAQGGIQNPNAFRIAPKRIKPRDAKLARTLKQLHREAKASMKANGGVLPDSERAALQARLDAAHAEHRSS